MTAAGPIGSVRCVGPLTEVRLRRELAQGIGRGNARVDSPQAILATRAQWPTTPSRSYMTCWSARPDWRAGTWLAAQTGERAC
jgi:hypothetical protein